MSLLTTPCNKRRQRVIKMKTPVVLLLMAMITICVSEKYTDRYDDINIDEILSNRRLLTAYVNCILDKGRCTPEGKELKLHVKDGIQTGCEKCTEKQRQGARHVVKYIKEKEAEFWEQFKMKYDPEDEHKEVYEKFLAADD